MRAVMSGIRAVASGMWYVASGFSRTVPAAVFIASTWVAQPFAQFGGPPPPPPPQGRVGAPVDLTGTWVAVVTEDWEWRMVTPKPGDYTTVAAVMSPQGRKLADSWTPAMDGRCEAYGVGGVMRMPLRLRISWQDDLTLKIDTDAGQQTRLLRFTSPGQPAPAMTAIVAEQRRQGVAVDGVRTLQGYSVAEWIRSGGAQDAFLERQVAGGGSQRWGSLRVVTRQMLPGWLRRNGVPYSESTTVTEHFTRFSHPDAGDWFIVTTVVEDPTYLTQPFVTSSNFRKEASDAKWSPAPCRTN